MLHCLKKFLLLLAVQEFAEALPVYHAKPAPALCPVTSGEMRMFLSFEPHELASGLQEHLQWSDTKVTSMHDCRLFRLMKVGSPVLMGASPQVAFAWHACSPSLRGVC